MFELGRIDFSNSDDFFREHDFHMTKEIRSFIRIVCDAHRCCSSGVNEEYMRGIELDGYAAYTVEHNAAVAKAVKETGKIPEDSYFESAWELHHMYYPPEGNTHLPEHIFLKIVTYGRNETYFLFLTMAEEPYKRYREELDKRAHR